MTDRAGFEPRLGAGQIFEVMGQTPFDSGEGWAIHTAQNGSKPARTRERAIDALSVPSFSPYQRGQTIRPFAKPGC
jgi:hypothetical protein